MANLFDGAEKIDTGTLAKFVVDVKSQRIKNYLLCDYYKVKSFLQKQEYKEACLDNMVKELLREYNSKSGIEKRKVLKEELLATLNRAGSRNSPDNLSDEMLSSMITKQAWKSFSFKRNHNMSIPQMNDFLFAQYPLSKKENPEKTIEKWHILAAVLLCVCVIGFWFNHMKPMVSIIFTIVLEAALYWYTERRIARGYINYFLWVCASHYGRKFEGDVESIPFNHLTEQEKKEFEGRLKVYHYLKKLMVDYQEQLEECQRRITQNKNAISKNKEFIQYAISDPNIDNDRKIQDKQAENTQLDKEILELNSFMLEKESGIEETKPCCDEVEELLCDTLHKVYLSHFQKVVFEKTAFLQILSLMSVEDMEIMERRLLELDHSKEPVALAKKERNDYAITFSLFSGDTGKVLFKMGNGKVIVIHVERSGLLREIPISPEEIRNILTEDILVSEVESIIQNYENELANANHSISALNSSIMNLEDDKRRLSKDIKTKQKEITDLSDTLKKNESTIKTYENMISKSNKKEIELRSQIGGLEEEKNKLKNKLQTEKNNREKASRKIQELNGQLQEKENEHVTKIKTLTSQIDYKNKEILDLQKQLDKYSNMETDFDSAKQEKKRLEDEKRILKKEKEGIKKKLKEEQDNYDALVVQKREFEEAVQIKLKKKDKEIEGLNHEMESKDSHIHELQKALDSIPKQTKELFKQIDYLKNDNVRIQKELDQKEKNLDSLETENNDLRKRNRSVGEKLRQAEEEVERLINHNRTMENELEENDKKRRTLINEKNELQNQVRVNNGLIKQYESSFQTNSRVIAELKENNISFEKQIKKKENRIQNLEKYKTQSKEFEKEIAQKKQEIEVLKKKLDDYRIPSQSHYRDLAAREEFEKAITEAKKYVYIVSPWVAGPKKRDNNRYDERNWKTRLFMKLCKFMDDAVKRGVEIRIVYGYNDQYEESIENNPKDNQSIAAIEEYQKCINSSRFKTHKSNTHEKLIIVDDRYFLLGSYNVLSFSAPYDEDMIDIRHEMLFKSDDAEELKNLKEEYFDDSLF